MHRHCRAKKCLLAHAGTGGQSLTRRAAIAKARHRCHAGRNVHARVWHSRTMPQRAPHHAARGVFTNEIKPVE